MSSVVPDGWGEHRQGDVADFSNGKAYKLTEWEKVGTPVIRLQNLTGSGKNYYYSNLKLPDRQYCESGDLLYMWSATFGPHIWKGPKAIYHYHIWKITCNETDLTKRFLYQLLGYKTAEWLNQSNGMGILHITKGGMEELKLILPPLPEQQKIAQILTSVDEVIEKTQAQIDKLKDLKTAMMQELLTKGVCDENGKRHVEFKDSPVGWIPVGWEALPLSALVKNHRPITYGIVQTGINIDDGIPCVRVVDLMTEELSPQKMIRTTNEINNSYKRTILQLNDIMFALRGSIGHVRIVDSKLVGANLTRGVALISANDLVSGTFLLWAIRSPRVRNIIQDGVNGSALQEIPLGNLRGVNIPLPSIAEQKQICKTLDSLEENISKRKLKLKNYLSLKKALMQDLLTGKVRVKVN